MQRPFDRHLNSTSGQGMLQFCSSEPSPQSSVPSQIVADGVQLPFLHWKVPALHCLGGQLEGSSEPSLQSFSPSHLEHLKFNKSIFPPRNYVTYFQNHGIHFSSLPPHLHWPDVQLAMQFFPSGAK
jgi:hypothetical protein